MTAQRLQSELEQFLRICLEAHHCPAIRFAEGGGWACQYDRVGPVAVQYFGAGNVRLDKIHELFDYYDPKQPVLWRRGEGLTPDGRATWERFAGSNEREGAVMAEATERTPDYFLCPIEHIQAGWPGQNVRQTFDEEGLAQLAQSIREVGVLEPLIVREVRRGTTISYELIAGERRLRAAKQVGLKEIPVVVRYIDGKAAAKLQLVENLQRRDLDPIEEARGYQRLIDEHGMRQTAVAQELGVSESHISNRRRLLRLPEAVQSEISCENLSASVALSLVDLAGSPDIAQKVAEALVEQNATQERAPKIVDQTLAHTCPVVQWSGYPYGARQQTCDQSAHKDCACRRRVKQEYGTEIVVCIDLQRYAEVEASAQAKIEEHQRKQVERAQAKADAEDGVLDLEALQWSDYGNEARYQNVESPYGDHPQTCEGDHSQCACLRRGKGPHGDHEGVRLICIDPKQFKRVERAAGKERNKAAIAQLATENERLSAWALSEIEDLESEGLTTILGLADLAYLAAWVFTACDIGAGPNYVPRADRRKYLEGLDIHIEKLPAYLAGERRRLAEAFIASGDSRALLQIIYEWPLIAQGNSPNALGHWYRCQVDPEVAAAAGADPDGDEDDAEAGD